jgi:hypothetical protein
MFHVASTLPAPGVRALEWAVAMPDRVATPFLLSSGAVASADRIGTQTTVRHGPDPARSPISPRSGA